MKYWKVTFFDAFFILLEAEDLSDASLSPGVITEITKKEYDEIVSQVPSEVTEDVA